MTITPDGTARPLTPEEHIPLDVQLLEYVLARNNLRSCTVAAEGAHSGARLFNLRAAQKRELAAMRTLAPWLEDEARYRLCLAPRHRPDLLDPQEQT